MKDVFNEIKDMIKNLHGKPLYIGIACLILVIVTVVLSFVFLIGKDSSGVKTKPLTAQEQMVKDKQEEVEEELGVERNKYGEVKYDEEKLENYAYTTEDAEEISDYAVDQLNSYAKDRMELFDFTAASDTMIDESKKHDTLQSKKYNEVTRPLIDDLVMASAIDDSYLSDVSLTKDNLSLIQDDVVYFYALMAMDPDFRTQYTIDKNSLEAAISKESSKSLNQRLVIKGEIEDVMDGAVYKRVKDILPYDFDNMKRVPFAWGGNEFYGYFVTAGDKRDFVGFYDKDPSKPSNYTSVKEWEALVKEKREMRDPATSNWQEGGPDKSLMPRPDLTEEVGDFGADEFEEKKIVPKGPQEEAEWPEELNN